MCFYIVILLLTITDNIIKRVKYTPIYIYAHKQFVKLFSTSVVLRHDIIVDEFVQIKIYSSC